MAGFETQIFHNTKMNALQPIMWDSALDQQMITNYNQLLNDSDFFFGNFESSDEASPRSHTSPSSTRSSSTSPKTGTNHPVSIPDKMERRREQNRQSQRAYRDRKDKHQRELEAQIAVWREKHERLDESFTAQSEQVSQLKAQIEDLNTQVTSLQSGLSDKWGRVDISQQEFEFISFYDINSGLLPDVANV